MSSFNINFPGTPQDFLTNANKTIKEKGGVFSGDDSKGNFSIHTLIGPVEGNYQVNASESDDADATKITITITKKPFIVPLSKIEETITSYF